MSEFTKYIINKRSMKLRLKFRRGDFSPTKFKNCIQSSGLSLSSKVESLNHKFVILVTIYSHYTFPRNSII